MLIIGLFYMAVIHALPENLDVIRVVSKIYVNSKIKSMTNFENQRRHLRQVYFDVWDKMKLGQELEPMEERIAIIIQMHPEYHRILELPDSLDRDYNQEHISNPFFHMGFHIAIHEQIGLNNPIGIQEVYLQLAKKYLEPHIIEHKMIDCLSEFISLETQEIDSDSYLTCLKNKL